MKEFLVIYGSTTGNTEFVARRIAENLLVKGANVVVRDVVNAQPSELAGENDTVILGCSTWGEDEIGLQEDFESFYLGLHDLNLAGKRFALFGCGDSGYKHFCGAVDKIELVLKEQGALIVDAPLKIDGEPEGSLDEIDRWSADISAAL